MKINISKKAWIFLGCGVFLILIAWLGMTYYNQSVELADFNKQISQTRQQSAKIPITELTNQEASLKSQQAQNSARIYTVKRNLTQSTNAIAAVETLYALADSCHVDIKSVKSGGLTEQKLGEVSLTDLPLVLNVEGEVADLLAFITGISAKFITSIEKPVGITVPPPTPATTPSPTLTPLITPTPTSSSHPLPTPVPAEVVTGAASNLHMNSATLNGNLISMGDSGNVVVFFDYGVTSTYTASTQYHGLLSPGPFSADISGLMPNLTYHFRAKGIGTSIVYGSDILFTTLATENTPAPTTTSTPTANPTPSPSPTPTATPTPPPSPKADITINILSYKDK